MEMDNELKKRLDISYQRGMRLGKLDALLMALEEMTKTLEPSPAHNAIQDVVRDMRQTMTEIRSDLGKGAG